MSLNFFFFNDTATTEIYTLSLHDALPISGRSAAPRFRARSTRADKPASSCCSARTRRSEEHTSELQSQFHLVCRLLLEKKKTSTPIRHSWRQCLEYSILRCLVLMSTRSSR